MQILIILSKQDYNRITHMYPVIVTTVFRNNKSALKLFATYNSEECTRKNLYIKLP